MAVGASRLVHRLPLLRRVAGGLCIPALLSLLFLLSAVSHRVPSISHQFRSRSQSQLSLDQGDGAVAGEAYVAMTLPAPVRTRTPVPAPQPRVRPLPPAPLLRHCDGVREAHALRGPPRAV